MIQIIILKKNRKTETPLKVERGSTYLKRFCGLMFIQKLPRNKVFHLIPCNSIHMFFMRIPIDVVFLNKNLQVAKKIEGLKPWHVVTKVKNAYSTIECPVGTIKEYEIEVGDYLHLV